MNDLLDPYWEQKCVDCRIPMRDERCPNVDGYCLDCCGCDDHKIEEEIL